jgi:hypothetical protein
VRNEGIRGLGRFAGGPDCRSENGRAREVARQWTDQFRTGNWHDFRTLRDSEF